MTIGQFLVNATKRLAQAGIETARLDCLVLLEDVTGIGRGSLLAHPERPLPDPEIATLNKFITHREQPTPLAYIRGKAAFFGRDFLVNTDVLTPRPETEAMIELLLNSALPAHPRIADVGTGSGCIGITAALELPQAKTVLYDIDPQALEVARNNAQIHHAAVQCRQQDLLAGLDESFDVILANLPYVPDDYAINRAARFEPDLALFAGKDGLDAYRKLWMQIAALAHRPGHIFTEALPFQHDALRTLAREADYRQLDSRGLIQQFVPSMPPVANRSGQPGA